MRPIGPLGSPTASNEASIRLHHKLAFETVGHLKEVGTKFGTWLDLAFLQAMLDGRTKPDGLTP
jgi:phosphinothricin acetyltransferase